MRAVAIVALAAACHQPTAALPPANVVPPWTLVDAKGVSRLYRARISTWSLVLMLIVGLFALGAALWSTDGGRALLQVLGARIDDLWSSIQGVFG